MKTFRDRALWEMDLRVPAYRMRPIFHGKPEESAVKRGEKGPFPPARKRWVASGRKKALSETEAPKKENA